MNPFLRYWKFNLVGAIGMVVQLAALALINRFVPGHYLCATAAAIELALLHNFVWHLRFTWRDRRDRSSPLAQLVRFHLANGLVSMLGNLALMRILVHSAHLPLLAANGIAILCCSVANFCLGNNWAFAAKDPEAQISAGVGTITPSPSVPSNGGDASEDATFTPAGRVGTSTLTLGTPTEAACFSTPSPTATQQIIATVD